jgi:hypothetical protein
MAGRLLGGGTTSSAATLVVNWLKATGCTVSSKDVQRSFVTK